MRRRMKIIVLLLVFIGVPVVIVLPTIGFIADLAFQFGSNSVVPPGTAQLPRWDSLVTRLVLITIGGMVTLLAVIALFGRIIPEDDYPPVDS